eukprot:1657037-Rhodomonas_salina.1
MRLLAARPAPTERGTSAHGQSSTGSAYPPLFRGTPVATKHTLSQSRPSLSARSHKTACRTWSTGERSTGPATASVSTHTISPRPPPPRARPSTRTARLLSASTSRPTATTSSSTSVLSCFQPPDVSAALIAGDEERGWREVGGRKGGGGREH